MIHNSHAGFHRPAPKIPKASPSLEVYGANLACAGGKEVDGNDFEDGSPPTQLGDGWIDRQIRYDTIRLD